MTLCKDIMPYFDIYTCSWLKYEYIEVPLKNLDAQKFTIAKFRHPVSKSWLRPCPVLVFYNPLPFYNIDRNLVIKIFVCACFFLENVVWSVSAVASGSDGARGGLARYLPHEGTGQGAEVKGHTIKKVELF